MSNWYANYIKRKFKEKEEKYMSFDPTYKYQKEYEARIRRERKEREMFSTPSFKSVSTGWEDMKFDGIEEKRKKEQEILKKHDNAVKDITNPTTILESLEKYKSGEIDHIVARRRILSCWLVEENFGGFHCTLNPDNENNQYIMASNKSSILVGIHEMDDKEYKYESLTAEAKRCGRDAWLAKINLETLKIEWVLLY